MLKLKSLLIISLCVLLPLISWSNQAYFNKFTTYTHWKDHLPTEPTPDFLDFINQPSPLTQKLREKWLYQLAANKNWNLFSQYYTGSTDSTLQCYAQIAAYNQGAQQKALLASIPLWLNGASQPKACDELFNLLLTSHALHPSLIHARIALALEQRNVSLAIYLLKQYQSTSSHEVDILTAIVKNPTRITLLEPSTLHSLFCLYGLKQLISRNPTQAIRFWQQPHIQKQLNHAQKQAFLAHLALYKAMRAQSDAPVWFAQVEPEYYNDVLLDWQLRFAISQHQWSKLLHLISYAKDKQDPCWQYWTARALEATNDQAGANQIYATLSTKRNYYGFLASARIHVPLHFEAEEPTTDLTVLKDYTSLLTEIHNLYQNKQILQAARIINDFLLELPKAEKSAFIYWLDRGLNWQGKSVYLASNIPELSNQLALRFPLTYLPLIQHYAHEYDIPSALILAIIRQESGFNNDIMSPVGAQGLMQLMPATANLTAKQAHIAYSPAKLFLTDTNIHIGIAYLKNLAKSFHQHPVLMAAAYNAGPKQVNYWLKHQTSTDLDVWIETLPWRETRNYLKNILAFYAVYQFRLKEQPSIAKFIHEF